MDVQALFQEFMGSDSGSAALKALGAAGIAPDQAQQFLSTAVAAGHDHVESQASQAGILGQNPGRNFFAALAAGLTKGDGLWGSMKDGLQGMLSARITEAVGTKFGLDTGKAQMIAAAVTPYLQSFLKSKLGGA